MPQLVGDILDKMAKNRMEITKYKINIFLAKQYENIWNGKGRGAYFGVIGRIHHGVPKPGYDTVRWW